MNRNTIPAGHTPIPARPDPTADTIPVGAWATWEDYCAQLNPPVNPKIARLSDLTDWQAVLRKWEYV